MLLKSRNRFEIYVYAIAIAGVGTGVGAAVFADIARVTSKAERTAVMSVFMGVREFGLVAGKPSHGITVSACNTMNRLKLRDKNS